MAKDKKARAEQRRLEAWNKQHKLIDGVDHKICNRCKKWLPSNKEYFYKNKNNGIDGLFPYCKKCNIKESRQWVLDNVEHVAKVKSDWHYREENYERRIAEKKKRRERKKEEIAEYNAQYRKDNKDKFREYRSRYKKHNISKKEWNGCMDYFNSSCAYCGMTQEDAKATYGNLLHKEHLDNEGMDDLSNCVPACRDCNTRKWTFAFEDWYDIDNPSYTTERYNKVVEWLKEDYKNYIE